MVGSHAKERGDEQDRAENYPVADLPEDLREGFADVERVRVVLEPMVRVSRGARPSLDELFAMATPFFASFEEVVSHIDELRSEWD